MSRSRRGQLGLAGEDLRVLVGDPDRFGRADRVVGGLVGEAARHLGAAAGEVGGIDLGFGDRQAELLPVSAAPAVAAAASAERRGAQGGGDTARVAAR